MKICPICGKICLKRFCIHCLHCDFQAYADTIEERDKIMLEHDKLVINS